jgi:hypothetical protein
MSATKVKPFPVPLEFDAESGEITCQGAPVASMYALDDFPCYDADDEANDPERDEAEYAATGAELVRRYNLHADLLLALIEAEKMLTVAMREDLCFGEKRTERIIAGHSGMQQIRDAIAKAKVPA